jgi:hypothetical protein
MQHNYLFTESQLIIYKVEMFCLIRQSTKWANNFLLVNEAEIWIDNRTNIMH